MLGNTFKVIALSVVTLLPLTTSANNFNYNMLEVRIGTSPGTFGAEINANFTDNTHIIVRGDSEFSGDWDVAGGVGFNGPLGQFADMQGQFLAHNIKNVSRHAVGDTWVTEINFGLRLWLTQVLEGRFRFGKLLFEDENEANRSVFTVGTRFHSTDVLSIGVDIKNHGVYGHQISMGVNFSF